MVKTERIVQWIAYSALCGIGLIWTGCAARTDPPSLQQARATYAQAEQNSQVTTYAPAELQEARQSLQQAERVWEHDQDEREMQHQSYMVEQRVKIAHARAEQKMAEQDMQQLSRERDAILLKTREYEAQRSQREAMQAHAQAQLAQQRAAQAQQQAEQARQQAEQSQQARQLAAAQTLALAQQLSMLRAQMQETARGTVLTLSDVLFEVNQAELKPGALHNLFPLVTFLQEKPERSVVIEGHTDSTGSEAYNRDLSQHRAEAVRHFLIQNGIEAERITAHGYGEAYPVASNDTQSGRQQNRRVEIVFPKE